MRSAPTGGVDDARCHVGSRLHVFRFRALARAQHRTQEEFLAETIPAFGAGSTLHRLNQSYPDYTYRSTARPSSDGAGGNGIDDVLGCYVRRVLSVRHARSSPLVFGIRRDAHRRELVLPVDHLVQCACDTRSADPVKDHMTNGIHRRMTVAPRLFPDAQDSVVRSFWS